MTARYCPTCLTFATPQQFRCSNCGEPRPADGWPQSKPNRYGWLGEELDGRYRLLQFIGFGSTGEVYRAVSKRVGRSYAAKIIDRQALPRNVDFDELSQRLHREVAVLGAIRSPYVVPIVDFLQLDNDLYVLIMDLALGLTLERMIFTQHRIPVARALEISEQILEALGDIHDRGVVHRDLKPENIVVQTLRSGRPFVRLLDFGIAKLKDQPQLTRGFVGTPLFSSPEQIENAEDVDERCDLYAVGCILYAMLTGAPPFTGDTSLEVMQRHLTMPIPSVGELTDSPVLDRAIDEFLSRALSKKRDARFASAADMLSALVFDVTRVLYEGESLGGADTTALRQAASASRLNVGHTTKPSATNHTVGSSPSETGAHQAVGASVSHAVLNASGEICIGVSSDGRLHRWDMIDLALVVEGRVDRGQTIQAAFFTRDESMLCVVGERGEITFVFPRTLEVASRWRVDVGRIAWAGPSATRDDCVLLLTDDEFLVVGATQGVCGRVESGFSRAEVSASHRDGEDAHRLLLRNLPFNIRVREPSGSVAPTVQRLPSSARMRESGRVLDVSPSGLVLVEREGRFFEYDPLTHELRTLGQPPAREWADAFFLSMDAGFAARSLNGELFLVRRGDRPQAIGQDVMLVGVSRDRSRIVGFDRSGGIHSWAAQHGSTRVPEAPRPEPVVEAAISDHWDIGRTVDDVVLGTEAGAVLVRMRIGRTWTEWPVPEARGLQSIRLSEDSSAAYLLDLSGQLFLVDAQGVHRLQTEKSASRSVIASGSRKARVVCVGAEDGTLTAFTFPEYGGRAAVRWRRPIQQPISCLRVSNVAGRVAIGCRDGVVQLVDMQHGAQLLAMPNTHGAPIDFSFSPDGHMLAMLRPGGIAEVYDANAGRLAYRQQVEGRDGVRRIQLEPDGSLIVAERFDTRIDVYRVQDGQLRSSVSLHGNTGAHKVVS